MQLVMHLKNNALFTTLVATNIPTTDRDFE